MCIPQKKLLAPLLVNNTRRKTLFLWGDVHGTTPDAVMVTLAFGIPDSDPIDSIFLTMFIPSTTSPKTTCLPSNHEVTTVVMKNCGW